MQAILNWLLKDLTLICESDGLIAWYLPPLPPAQGPSVCSAYDAQAPYRGITGRRPCAADRTRSSSMIRPGTLGAGKSDRRRNSTVTALHSQSIRRIDFHQIIADSRNAGKANASITNDLRFFDHPSGGTLDGAFLEINSIGAWKSNLKLLAKDS